MEFRTVTGLSLRFVLLTVLYLAASMIFSGMFSAGLPVIAPEEETQALLGALLMAAVDVIIIMIIALRSRLYGWKLAGVLAFSMYGVITVMSSIEALYFGPSLGITAAMIPGLILPGLFIQALIAPAAVLILGKFRKPADLPEKRQPMLPAGELVLKLGVIAVLYFVLYYGFGMMIAWQNPALQNMYQADAHPDVFNIWKIFGLQLGRSVLWVAFAWPVMRTLEGSTVSKAVITGLLYALPMNIVHFMPNPFMPDPSVRLSHFIETSTSNFIFGLIVVWLLHRSHTSLTDLFRRTRTRAV